MAPLALLTNVPTKLSHLHCHIALCAESEVRKAVERSSYAVALKFRVFFLLLKSVKF